MLDRLVETIIFLIPEPLDNDAGIGANRVDKDHKRSQNEHIHHWGEKEGEQSCQPIFIDKLKHSTDANCEGKTDQDYHYNYLWHSTFFLFDVVPWAVLDDAIIACVEYSQYLKTQTFLKFFYEITWDPESRNAT